MEVLAKKVRELRKDKGWTRRELARRTGLHETHLSKIEGGTRTRIEVETLIKLCQALGCTSDYLIGLTGATDAADAAGVPSGHPRQAAAVASASN